jgi:hypothetical protein
MLPYIWDILLSCLEGTEHESHLRVVRNGAIPDFHYSRKIHDRSEAGPFAMLVREVWRHASVISNNDFLELPEIMQDICNGYAEKSGVCVHEIVSKALQPRIVKFKSVLRTDRSCLKSALTYLWAVQNNEPLSIESNTCFDGRGMVISADQIVSVTSPESDIGAFRR